MYGCGYVGVDVWVYGCVGVGEDTHFLHAYVQSECFGMTD